MKKLLALVLALVMSMSLVTISNAAFKDADKIDYDEAVTVMNAVGVLVGDENSNFNAKENLTRAQAAKIISYLLLGNKTAEALAGSGKFTDVAKNSWSAGFVDYCASTGVVNGVGDGKFDPNGQLTGYQFAKMLLVALGYDATIEGFTGADWQINVSKRADQADLFDNLDISGNAALTREPAAQMCLNTLKSPLVEYNNKGGSLTVNGATVNIGASNPEYKTSSTKLADQTIYANKLNSSAGEYIVEFAEQYYPKLVLSEKFDDFERPCYTWSYDKKDLGTFAKTELLEKTFVGEVTGKDLYDLLGKTVVEDYETFVAIDGVEDKAANSDIFAASAMNKNNKKAVGGTDTGVVTEVYVNNDAKEVYIVIINEYLAIASKDYDTKKESVNLKVYGIEKVTNDPVQYAKETEGTENAVTFTGVSSDDFALLTEAKEDDAYVVTVAKGAIQTVVKADIVEDTAITSFKLGSNVKADGTTYNYSSAAEYDVDVLDNYTTSTGSINLKDKTYNIYLDTHGNLLGIDLVKAADNYVFITGVDSNISNLSAKNYDAAAIFVDGTMKTITFKADKSTGVAPTTASGETANYAVINKWFTYTVDKDGVYTLTVVAGAIDTDNGVKTAQYADPNATRDIDKKNIALRGADGSGAYSGVYGNDDTVYLLAELKGIVNGDKNESVIISGVDSVTTGVKNASLKAWKVGTSDTDTGSVWDKYEVGTPLFDIAAKNDVSGGTYTLYKSNGYIIAAVVVGEDNEASKNLVYVNSKAPNYEAYDKTTDEWTWTREVIIDGEKAELTEVGDSLTYVSETKMVQNNWYQVKYNAKGQVIGAVKVTESADMKVGTDYVTDIDNTTNGLYNAITKVGAKDSILYTESFTSKVPTMKGSTLYVDKTLTQGFYVDEDAKVVFIQKNDGKTTTEYEVGSKEVQNFIENLNAEKDSNPATYNYTISAILQNGAAKVVIIKDDADSTYDGGKDIPVITGLPETTITGLTVNVALANGESTTAYEKAVAKLVAEGYKVEGVKIDATTGEYAITASKDGVSGYVFTTRTTIYFKVTVKVADSISATVSATANVGYAASGNDVTVTIKKNSGTFTSNRTITAYESDGKTAIGTPTTVTVPSSPAAGTVTGTYTMTAKDTILVIS